MRSLMWFRADLRVGDNAALTRACAEATRGVVAVFCVCPEQWKQHDWGGAKVSFVMRTVESLAGDLRKLKIPLLIQTCDTFAGVPELMLQLAMKHECDTLFFNREFEVNEQKRDDQVRRTFERAGLGVQTFLDQTAVAPGAIRTGKGDFYSVFTPFRKAWMEYVTSADGIATVSRPKTQSSFVTGGDDVPVDDIKGFDLETVEASSWPAGENEAKKRLKAFVADRMGDYAKQRDQPAVDTTSRLSPYLAAGAISVRQCLIAAMEANGGSLNGRKTGAATWISELIWREFYRHVLVGWPRVCKHRAFREQTEKIRWRTSDADFEAWCEGRTGIPIVDAAMRQMNQTGWMHNRLRMIAAMFFSKQLLLDWRRGERYFMQRLVDGDLASNNGGWQWSASTGTDAAPYFRIFNPYSQSRKFDADGAFIRKFVPELKELDNKTIHAPHELSSLFQDLDYPKPIVDHAKARERAIKAFEAIK